MSIQTARKTGEPERKIYLSEEMKGLLKGLIGDRTEGFIFLTAKGQALDLRQPPGAVAETRSEGAGPEGRHAVHLPQDIHIRGDQQEERQPRLGAQLAGHNDLTMLLKHYLEEAPAALKRAVEEVTRKGGSPPSGTP